ncbi:LysR family transcriptional regulator [Leptolyngbya cf. ectocarpi LEGE 11479]|uniref:LysR family transcriptional regulator n=1 Tax=Leptolyngbya cf. ectocarpi LEGE 11479 TaxID=1828722 RepID=A0A928X3I6_LEPEC|nr:LysR family transcriptional regulator [Leptolyngbya ectocarpi]MBE9067220.1 LysR family transcriptional regulator [Leptolyngbya cf. ectocarpi LEGE 11479]
MLKALNQLPELIAFVESVEAASFSAAARSLGTTPSAISKRVAKLEDRLGVRLLQRTTRSLSLTAEGITYYERVARLLQELDDANDSIISGGKKPRGKLTVSASLDFGQSLLVQTLPTFLAQYPEIQVDLRISDRLVDLAAEGIDVAIRLGDLEDSSLIRRHLGRAQFILCASPDYLDAQGTPKIPADLVHHNCMRYIFDGHPLPWEFLIDGSWHSIPVSGYLNSDSGEALKNAALSGMGIARLLSFQVEKELETQQLISLFPDQLPLGLSTQAVFTHRRNLSPRVQVFLNFLSTYCTVS